MEKLQQLQPEHGVEAGLQLIHTQESKGGDTLHWPRARGALSGAQAARQGRLEGTWEAGSMGAAVGLKAIARATR